MKLSSQHAGYSLRFPAANSETAGGSEDASNEGEEGDGSHSQRERQLLELVDHLVGVVPETGGDLRTRLVGGSRSECVHH